MATPRLYHPQLTVGRVTLSKDESHHAGSVLRCRPGDPVVLFDGQGREAAAVVAAVAPRAVTVDVAAIDERSRELGIRLTLAVALPRSHRQTFLFEKLTELGVSAIWPMVTERSVVRPRADHVAKWNRTTIEAAKQSERAWLPHIQPPTTFDETLTRVGEFDTALVTDRDTSHETLSDHLGSASAITSLLVWIGPEGGLTPDEISAALNAGATPVSLGSHILRVETAAIAVAAIVGLIENRPTQ